MSAPPPGDPLIGQVIDDRYRILRVIGLGGMGVVYEAEATRLGSRLCAVKVLLPEYTRNENAVARFAREAQVAARVKHPNVVEIFDTGTTRDGLGYIAMELLRGETLDSTLERDGPLPWPRAQRIILQICRALAAAHAEGIVHRDMKPENCFRCGRDDDADFIKVLDFGIAKLTTPEAGRLTATNSVMGTYSYMAYEQICGEEVDHRVDIWASGVILYELLTGQLPFNGNNPGQIWRAITENDPALMNSLAPQAGIPEALEPIVRQAVARSLDDRYPSIEAFARALASIPADGTIRSVTGKLPAVAANPGVAARIAKGGQRLAQRTPGALTGLGPEDLVDTNETVIFAAASSATPGHRPRQAAGRSEAMRTATGMPQQLARSAASKPAAARHGPRWVAPLLVGLGLPAVAVAGLLLFQGTGAQVTETVPLESSVPDVPAAPATERAPETIPPTPESAPSTPIPEPEPAPPPPIPELAAPALASDSVPPTPEPQPEPEPAAPAPASDSGAPTPTAPTPVLSFSERAGRTLQKFSNSAGLRGCFTDAVPSMVVTVTVAAARGVGTVSVPKLKVGSTVANCIEKEFAKAVFRKGAAGDTDYVQTGITLPRATKSGSPR